MKLVVRVLLVACAMVFLVPHIQGVRVQGSPVEALEASVLFNLAIWGLECLLAVLVLSINIGTLGLGGFLAAGLKFVATLLAPSVALMGTSLFLPEYLEVTSFFPGALVSGLVLGGLVWITVPAKSKARRDD